MSQSTDQGAGIPSALASGPHPTSAAEGAERSELAAGSTAGSEPPRPAPEPAGPQVDATVSAPLPAPADGASGEAPAPSSSVWADAKGDAGAQGATKGKKAKKPKKPKSRLRRWLGRIGKTFVGFIAFVLIMWGLAHAFPGFGAWMADALRSVFGARFVAWLEDVAYDIQDRVERWRHGEDAPTTLWDVPAGSGAAPAPSALPPPPSASASGSAGPAVEPPFAPPATELPFDKVASAGDGTWIAMPDLDRPSLTPALFKTMIHPDPRRPFAVLAVVAVDVRAVELHLVAGVTEPESMQVRMAERPGKIPSDDYGALLAAFNGGFKAVHGQYGMVLDGKTFLPPRDFACTIVRYNDDTLRIGSWNGLKDGADRVSFLRQTPPCLVEEGDVHKALLYDEYAKGWGATVSGDTVIRRSALGLDASGQVLFYGIGEAMTAQSLAIGMRATGADAVAELDVNYSYPRFLIYKRPSPDEPPRVDSPLIPKIDATPDQYVTRPSARDFFYLTRRPERKPAPGSVPAASSAVPEPPASANSGATSASAAGSASAAPRSSSTATPPGKSPATTPSK